MYNLGVERRFIARHYLIGGDWGDENIEHSHSYRLELTLEKKRLDRHGFLVDIVEVEQQLGEVVAIFRDKTLNSLDCLQGVNPSIERLATVCLEMFKERFADFQLEALCVKIWEDDIAWTSLKTTF